MQDDAISRLLEKYGPYQRRLILLLTFPLIMIGCTNMMVVITFFLPNHRCKIPGLPNDTFPIEDDYHRMMVNMSIPLSSSGDYSQCEMYTYRNSSDINRTLYGDTEPCQSWVYDRSEFDNTIATQFDLVCDKKGFRANFNMIYMIGLLVSSLLSGLVCDRYGRKTVFYFSMLIMFVIIPAGAFPVIPEMLLVYHFLNGFVATAMYLALYVLSLEFMGPSQRTFAGTMMMLLWLIGPFSLGGVSFLVTDWRWIQIISAAPFIFCASYWWLIPESPRWLVSKGRQEEALDIVTKVARVNNLPLPNQKDVELNEAAGKAEKEGEGGKENTDKGGMVRTDKGGMVKSDKGKMVKTEGNKNEAEDKEKETMVKKGDKIPSESPLKLLKYPNLIARSGVIFFNWMVISMTYYGLSLNVANLAGSVRVNFLLSNAVELVGYCAAWLLLDRLGRKRTHCAAMLLSGTSCLATIFTVTYGGPELQWLTTALAMVGKLGISAAFNSVYLISGELFPTVIRNFGVGCSSTVGRVGSAVSPYIADLSLYTEGSFGPALPLIIFGALAVAAGLMSLSLPETLHRKLPETIWDAVNFTRRTEMTRDTLTHRTDPSRMKSEGLQLLSSSCKS